MFWEKLQQISSLILNDKIEEKCQKLAIHSSTVIKIRNFCFYPLSKNFKMKFLQKIQIPVSR